MKDFQDYSDYHMILERKPTILAKWVRENRTNEKLIHIVNSVAVKFLPTNIPIIRTNRATVTDDMNIKEYTNAGLFDKFVGLTDATSVMIQALHLAGIMGCGNIYMCGAEMVFKKQRHYYVEEIAMSNKPADRLKSKATKKIPIMFNGDEHFTIPVYKNSAIAANKLIKGEFKKLNVSVSDFSGGLITEAIQINFDSFFK